MKYAIALAVAALAGAAAAQPKMTDAQLIASAESAGPPAISKAATIMVMDGKSMRTLRKGTNGWTCMPDDPSTPGPDPMCADRNGMIWGDALQAHKPPPPGLIGTAYMLAGGSDASNLDPFATKPKDGKWVTTGPHLMILNARVAANSGYPTKEANPDTSRPYVMFGGTPWAHIMVPTK